MFCDDLSFEQGEGGYKALKSILDGSVAGHRRTTSSIYATSNRRHLMPEFMSENLEAKYQEDGEIHPGETSEEKISLSERFGLWVSFYPFRQDDYLAVVGHWLAYFGAGEPTVEAARGDALRWALERGSRSGRVAWQFARDWAGRAARRSGAARASGALIVARGERRLRRPCRPSRSIVDVAVGVVLRADGAVLIGQRVAGKPYAGWWEFPGGKFEAGRGLRRRARARTARGTRHRVVGRSPWVVREHRLSACARVGCTSGGSSAGRASRSRAKGRPLSGCRRSAIDVAPLLPAAIDPVRLARPAGHTRSSDARRTRRRVLSRSARPASRGRAAGWSQLRAAALAPALDPSIFALFRAVAAALPTCRITVAGQQPTSRRRYWLAAGRPAAACT